MCFPSFRVTSRVASSWAWVGGWAWAWMQNDKTFYLGKWFQIFLGHVFQMCFLVSELRVVGRGWVGGRGWMQNDKTFYLRKLFQIFFLGHVFQMCFLVSELRVVGRGWAGGWVGVGGCKNDKAVSCKRMVSNHQNCLSFLICQ